MVLAGKKQMKIACITARGGSKRIPKKNIKLFCGKPIIAYSIEAALKSECFDEVMVSTDSYEISSVAQEYGAKVPFVRNKETANDFATTSDVIKEVIIEYDKRGISVDTLCCIYPTAPFITPDLLSNAMKKYESDTDVDAVIPVAPYSYPPQRGLVITNGALQMREPEYKTTRSQDIDKMYHDVGQFYLLNASRFMESGDLWAGKVLPLIISEMQTQDIDTYEDWEIAEYKYKYLEALRKGKKEYEGTYM